jgi:hypothetical protein
MMGLAREDRFGDQQVFGKGDLQIVRCATDERDGVTETLD